MGLVIASPFHATIFLRLVGTGDLQLRAPSLNPPLNLPTPSAFCLAPPFHLFGLYCAFSSTGEVQSRSAYVPMKVFGPELSKPVLPHIVPWRGINLDSRGIMESLKFFFVLVVTTSLQR